MGGGEGEEGEKDEDKPNQAFPKGRMFYSNIRLWFHNYCNLFVINYFLLLNYCNSRSLPLGGLG
jgi:hypothetical protein